MPNTELASLEQIINYAYSGSINMNISNIQCIFSLASLLQVTELLNACTDYMHSNLDASNAIGVYQFAKCHSNVDLELFAKEFINRNITDIVSKHVEFMQMEDTELLCELLSSDELNVCSEEFILDAVLKWIEFNYSARKSEFEPLLTKCVRLSLIERDRLELTYDSYQDLIEANQLCAGKFKSLLTPRDSVECAEIKRLGMNKPESCFLIIGGNCDLDDGVYVNCFNPNNGKKFLISRNFQKKDQHLNKGYFHIENPGVCVTDDNRIFVAGGNCVYHEYKLFSHEHSMKYKAKVKSSNKHYNNLNKDDENDSYNDGN